MFLFGHSDPLLCSCCLLPEPRNFRRNFFNKKSPMLRWNGHCVCGRALGTKKTAVSSAGYADRSDIDQAISSLSVVEERRLEQYARYKIRGLGRKAGSHTFEDLLNEAITAILIGAEKPDAGRHWRKTEVDFVKFVAGVMRSIASHWGESFEEQEYRNSDLTVESEDGQVVSPIDMASSSQPSQERTAIAKEELTAVLKLFEDDDDAILIVEALREGMTGPEIVEQLGMPKKQFEAGMKRIRYKVK